MGMLWGGGPCLCGDPACRRCFPGGSEALEAINVEGVQCVPPEGAREHIANALQILNGIEWNQDEYGMVYAMTKEEWSGLHSRLTKALEAL